MLFLTACNSPESSSADCPDGSCGKNTVIDGDMYIRFISSSGYTRSDKVSSPVKASASSVYGNKIIVTGQGLAVRNPSGVSKSETSNTEEDDENLPEVSADDIMVINGFNADTIGTNQYDVKNEEAIFQDMVIPIDMLDISRVEGELGVNIPVVFQYDEGYFKKTNSEIREAGGNDWRGFNENDITVYTFDKTEGKWKQYSGSVELDRVNNSISIAVSENGRYCYVYRGYSNEDLKKWKISRKE